MMIAMVGRMFFAAPQIASADNPECPIKLVVTHEEGLGAEVWTWTIGDKIVMVEYILKDGTMVIVREDGVEVLPPPSV